MPRTPDLDNHLNYILATTGTDLKVYEGHGISIPGRPFAYNAALPNIIGSDRYCYYYKQHRFFPTEGLLVIRIVTFPVNTQCLGTENDPEPGRFPFRIEPEWLTGRSSEPISVVLVHDEDVLDYEEYLNRWTLVQQNRSATKTKEGEPIKNSPKKFGTGVIQ